MLIATQFQGALNENGLKQLIVFLVLAMGRRWSISPTIHSLEKHPEPHGGTPWRELETV